MSFFKLRGLFSRKVFLNINAIIMQYPCLHKAQQYGCLEERSFR